MEAPVVTATVEGMLHSFPFGGTPLFNIDEFVFVTAIIKIYSRESAADRTINKRLLNLNVFLVMVPPDIRQINQVLTGIVESKAIRESNVQ